MITLEDLGLAERALKGLPADGDTTPTPIRAKARHAIPAHGSLSAIACACLDKHPTTILPQGSR